MKHIAQLRHCLGVAHRQICASRTAALLVIANVFLAGAAAGIWFTAIFIIKNP